MQRVEIGDPINTQDHGLTIEHKPLLPDLVGGLNDQAHALGVALKAEDLVPLGAGTLALCGDFLAILTGRSP